MEDRDYAPIGPNSAAGTPDQHFGSVLYVGTHSTGPQRIGGLNFQPDLVWIKTRNQSQNHVIFDSARGTGRVMYPTATSAEATDPNTITSFNSDGFSLGVDTGVNYNAKNHVAWCWKAGNEYVEDNSGTISVTRSTNTDAGFSILRYTAPGTAGATVAHGLNEAPDFAIFKKRAGGTAYGWGVYHRAMQTDATKQVRLDHSDGLITQDMFHNTEPTSEVFYLGGNNYTNYPADATYVAYVWHAVEGYSSFGTYEGNGNADGPFVYTGFRPAMVLRKRVDDDGHNWQLYDNKRPGLGNGVMYELYPDDVGVEGTSNGVDFLANGFKVRVANGGMNTSAKTHIYAAFAEMPFKYANAR